MHRAPHGENPDLCLQIALVHGRAGGTATLEQPEINLLHMSSGKLDVTSCSGNVASDLRCSVKRFAESGSVARMHLCCVFRLRVQSEGVAAGSLVVFVASPYVAAQPSPPV